MLGIVNLASDSEFQCDQCGYRCHADVNAAINISRAEPVMRPIASGRAQVQAPAFQAWGS